MAAPVLLSVCSGYRVGKNTCAWREAGPTLYLPYTMSRVDRNTWAAIEVAYPVPATYPIPPTLYSLLTLHQAAYPVPPPTLYLSLKPYTSAHSRFQSLQRLLFESPENVLLAYTTCFIDLL